MCSLNNREGLNYTLACRVIELPSGKSRTAAVSIAEPGSPIGSARIGTTKDRFARLASFRISRVRDESLASGLRRLDPEDGMALGDGREVRQRRARLQWQMVSTTARNADILAQHGRSRGGRDLDQVHALPTSVAQHGNPIGREDVLHPLGIGPEHRDEIPLAVEGRDDDGGRTGRARHPAAHFEELLERRAEPGGYPPVHPIDDAAERGRMPVPVEEPLIAALGWVAFVTHG